MVKSQYLQVGFEAEPEVIESIKEMILGDNSLTILKIGLCQHKTDLQYCSDTHLIVDKRNKKKAKRVVEEFFSCKTEEEIEDFRKNNPFKINRV